MADNPGALVGLCGISLIERLLRTLQRCGLTQAIVLSDAPEVVAQHLANPISGRPGGRMSTMAACSAPRSRA